ncbi:MAG TPA: phytanoyl-CoA dioxygenase family protein [Solirubrobacterales bacterium]|nr:phytanoyl-CoA dioxygenase family protein [Solirubrobacterales bacterium]
MLGIEVTGEERAAGRLGPESFRAASLLLHTAGYVVLRDALPRDLVADVRDAFDEILRDCMASRQGEGWYQVSERRQAVFWERGARWRIFPKLSPPLSDPRLLANPLVISLLEESLGPGFRCKFVSSDTCLRGSATQAPHRELGAGGAREPRAYVVNVPLARCTRRNGPIEVWPTASHLWSTEVLDRHGVTDDVQDGSNGSIEALARRLPSERLLLEPGSLLIRNPGMLHRGTPNRTRRPRSMLTVCYLGRGYDYDYGSAEYNLDPELLARLHPEVRRLFPELERDQGTGPLHDRRTAPSTQPLA